MATQIANSCSWQRWTPALLTAGGIVGALLLQHLLQWSPCPLCIVQRLTALGLFAALAGHALVRAPRARVATLWLGALFAAAGLVAAGAHLWLMEFPEQSSCGPGLALFVGRLVDALPGSEWLLEGSGPCDDPRYQILGVPLPAFSGALHLGAWLWALVLWHRQRGLLAR